VSTSSFVKASPSIPVAWLALARAVEASEPERARELVRRAALALEGAADNPDRRAAQRWLEEHA
jgi:hypothetical protein